MTDGSVLNLPVGHAHLSRSGLILDAFDTYGKLIGDLSGDGLDLLLQKSDIRSMPGTKEIRCVGAIAGTGCSRASHTIPIRREPN